MLLSGCLAVSCLAAEKNPLEVRLVSEVTAVSPGATFHVGLHLKHPEGYHSYWKHPGIVGLPTSVEWTLPEGFEAGEIQWPAPETVKMAKYTAQGYRGEVLLIVPMKAAESVDGDEVTLNAEISWMCCSRACSPAHAVPFSISLPVAEEAGLDEKTAPMFGESRASVAKPDERWEAKAVREGDAIVLEMKPRDASAKRGAEELGELRFFTLDGQVDSDGEQRVEVRGDGSIRWELTWSEYGPENPEALPGVVRAAGGWGPEKDGPGFIEISASY